jgi:hypothetical protein
MPRKHKYANRVKILKYVKAGEKWRFANVVPDSNSRSPERPATTTATVKDGWRPTESCL